MKHLRILLFFVVMVAVLCTSAWCDTVTITTIDESGKEITTIQNDNGSTLTITEVGGENSANADVNWNEDAPASTVVPQDTARTSADSGTSVSGGAANALINEILSENATSSANSGADITSGAENSAVEPTPAAAQIVVNDSPVPLVEQVKSALPESVQQALSTETDEQGNPVVSSRLVTLLLIIILVLLLIIVAGIVLVIVLVVTRRKNADKPGKRAGKHTAGRSPAGNEEEKTQETQPEE